MNRKWTGVGLVGALVCVAATLVAPSAAASSSSGVDATREVPAEEATSETRKPTFAELEFAHPVSLDSATSVTAAAGVTVEGYHFESDSIVGDFWPDAGLTVEQLLTNIKKATGTAPEVVSAYVSADEFSKATEAQRGTVPLLGENLPKFDAPDADASLAVRPEKTEGDGDGAARAAGDTWQPVGAQAQVVPAGDTWRYRLSIRGTVWPPTHRRW